MKENDIGQLINALSNKELIIRVDLDKSLKISKFKIGSLEMKGELGISFRDIKEVEKEEKEEIKVVDKVVEVKEDELEEKIGEISQVEDETKEEPKTEIASL